MKYIISIILIILVSSFPLMLHSQELKKTKGLISDIEKGDEAPFSGVLLDAWAMSEILTKMEYDLKRHELELEFMQKKKDAEWSLKHDSLKASFDSLQFRYDNIVKIKDKEIKVLREIAIDKKDYSIWWYTGGFLSGVALSLGVLYVASDALGR